MHRFGADIAGGSEGHCRVIAERLAERHDITVITTTARDHMTWRNEYPAGVSEAGALTVHRFPVVRQRSIRDFADISTRVFRGGEPAAVQEEWFRMNGPEAPGLLAYLEAHGHEYDRILFWSFRYYQSFFGVPLVAERAVLLPTAEEDPAIRIGLLNAYFTKPAGLVYLTPEEQELVERYSGRPLPPSCVVGSGLDQPPQPSTGALISTGIARPYVLYLGRIDPNKGCATLLRFFTRWAKESTRAVPLVMAGPANMAIPADDRIRALGFVDPVVREALLANASLIVIPSPFESLSMVLLEAWNHCVPALVNARCRVLKGQVQRAAGGLYYRNYDEFVRGLETLLRDATLAQDLGRSGHDYVERNYRWSHVMETLEQFLENLAVPARRTIAQPSS